MTEVDMFGHRINPQGAMTDAERRRVKRRQYAIPRGYAGTPGQGPDGERCRTCRHFYRRSMAKTYFKCHLNRLLWTGGPKTDIKATSPACEKWERPDG